MHKYENNFASLPYKREKKIQLQVESKLTIQDKKK